MNNRKLLIRDVPENLHCWIEAERNDRKQTQKEFLLNILQKAHRIEQSDLFETKTTAASPDSGLAQFKFIDLFAGIGGFRIALQNLGGRCVFSSEWNKYAQKTYREWFGETPEGDITTINSADIPNHDILAAGFPCQPFSLAGVSKKNSLGHEHGFKDKTQGTLFFHLATVIEIKRPPIIFLENVKNLKSHDEGRTWKVIEKTLEDLEYKVFPKIVDAANYVPQHRERILIVGFDKREFGDEVSFTFPVAPKAPRRKLRDILEDNPDPKYTLSTHLWKYLRDYAERHREKGNGFGYGLVDPDGISRTLSARYHKDGSEILIPQGKGRSPRRLTPREAARLMGYGDNLPIVVSDTQAYRQFGNSVCPLVIEDVGREIIKVMNRHLNKTNHHCLIKRSQQESQDKENSKMAAAANGHTRR